MSFLKVQAYYNQFKNIEDPIVLKQTIQNNLLSIFRAYPQDLEGRATYLKSMIWALSEIPLGLSTFNTITKEMKIKIEQAEKPAR